MDSDFLMDFCHEMLSLIMEFSFFSLFSALLFLMNFADDVMLTGLSSLRGLGYPSRPRPRLGS